MTAGDGNQGSHVYSMLNLGEVSTSIHHTLLYTRRNHEHIN